MGNVIYGDLQFILFYTLVQSKLYNWSAMVDNTSGPLSQWVIYQKVHFTQVFYLKAV